MNFKNYIKESKHNELYQWKKAFDDFAKASLKLSKAWEGIDIKDKKFLNAYAKVFKHSFDEIAYDVQELNSLAKNVNDSN